MSAPYPAAPPAPAQKNHPLGLVALITAALGFVFACIPGALILGWILLPLAFVLSIVALCMKGKKLFGVLAIALSVVGTIVGFIVFFTVVAGAVDEAFGGSDVAAVEPAPVTEEDVAEEVEEEPAGPVEGSRENPYAIGTTVSDDGWEVTINGVQLGATDAVLAENMVNPSPDEGDEYILVNVTATYIGADTGMPAIDLGFGYVTVDGVTVDGLSTFAVAPDSLDRMAELYNGASITGNLVYAVPSATAADGTVTVRIGMFGDDVFFAAK